MEIRKTELSRVVLLYLTQRYGNNDSELFSDLREVTRPATVTVWTDCIRSLQIVRLWVLENLRFLCFIFTSQQKNKG